MGCADDLTRTLERVATGGADVLALRENAPRTALQYHPQRTAQRLRCVLDRVLGRCRPR
jgi:hypothetical protein